MSAAQPHASGSLEPSHRGNASSTMNRNPSSGTGNGSGSHHAKSKRKTAKARGRKMMIKIFYSLQSPRSGSTSTPSAPTPASSAPSPDFFAVLDPSLSSASTAAPSPVPPQPVEPPHQATNYSCVARLSSPVTVQIVGSRKNASEGLDEKVQYGRVTLKTCLSAICISRPELVMDSTKDFSVSTVDPYESSAHSQPLLATSSSTGNNGSTLSGGANGPGQGLVEGKGMLSWTMAEKKEGTTMVTGRITGSAYESRRTKRRKGDDGNVAGDDDDDDESESGDETEETLEIWLQLSERDAFTQGQFLNCLRSYHNPMQHLQSEFSELNSSPPKPSRHEPASIPSSSSGTTSAALGDPVKRRRPSDRQSLPLSASTTALPIAPASAFANLAASELPSSTPLQSASNPSLALSETAAQNPDLLAFISQLVSSAPTGSTATNPSAPTLDLLGNQGALQSLARLCGLPVPEPAPRPPPSTQAPTSTSGPAPMPSVRPPKLSTSTSSESNAVARKRREHFAAIDSTELKGQGKNNPRDPNGCSNCKRKKSTSWRVGLGVNGSDTTVCNACGTFFNKNGYHRTKGGPDHPTSSSARPVPPVASTSNGHGNKPGRPLTGRLTATCEADLNKRKARKKVANGSPDSSASSSRIFGGAGIIPPLSPSKHVGPRSPSLAFGLSSSSRPSSTRASGIMSSPGRSPRLRNRPAANQGTAATSPLRAPADAFAQDGGFDFAALFGGHASPTPRKRTLSGTQVGGSGEKGVPNYLLTASPGTALDRILNETNIGSALSSLGEPMQVDGTTTAHDPNPFNFFLQPGSPSREHKENERPRASTAGPPSTTVEAPVTDADSFESVLSSLRRDFNNRLSSNALTAPSSPVPSSPCVQPRTSTATPGSKGKAPLSSGRAAPTIFDSFTDGLVTGIVHDEKSGGETSRTPHSDSDAWSPQDGRDDDDRTLTLGSLLSNGNVQGDTVDRGGGRSGTKSRPDDQYNYDISHLLVPNKVNGGNSTTRRAAFIPSHLVPASDATEFDLGSLPPSSPPQLPSETFPTPSDFDGVTPGTEGGDHDERERSGPEDPKRWTIEAVAEKVATEPDEEARATIMALLQSVGSEGAAVELPGVAGGDKVTLDRSTVDKLLSLISAKPSSSTIPAAVSTSAVDVRSESRPPTGPNASRTAVKVERASQESPDLSQIDFFNNFGGSGVQSQQQQQELHHSEQMNGLYTDLFSNNTQF